MKAVNLMVVSYRVKGDSKTDPRQLATVIYNENTIDEAKARNKFKAQLSEAFDADLRTVRFESWRQIYDFSGIDVDVNELSLED